MQINSINQNYSSMNFSGIFGKRDAKKTEHKDQNQDNSTIPVHSASKPSAKTRAVALAVAAMMALSLTACNNGDKTPETVANETAEAMQEMDDLSLLFLSKITPEQMAQFTPEQLIELAQALRVYNIDIGEIGDNSNVQINAQVIDGTFGDGVVISFVNGSEDVAIDDSQVGGENSDVGGTVMEDGTIKYYMIKNGDKGYVPMTKEEATAYLGYEPTVEGDNTSETSSAAENGGETEPEAEAEETGIKPTRASGAPDSGNYWRDEAQTVSSVWSEMTSKDSIVEATSDYASLSNKPFEFAAFLKGEGATARTGEPESELEAQELVYANAEAFQNLYSALEDENILAKYNLSGCGDDIKSYLDGFDKGDFNQDGDYSDDYKYLPNGTENPDKKD